MFSDARADHGHDIGQFLSQVAPDIDPTGIELERMVLVVANQFDAITDEHQSGIEISAPRLRLLIRMLAEEHMDTTDEGISSTYLSRCQNVSKNTISVMLHSLEEQGLVERAPDPDDKRVHRIRVSAEGRRVVRAAAPAHLARINQVVSLLDLEERQQLLALLAKLHRSLATNGGI
jgi:DNA-binding MarR family transcriptional regulator